MKVLDLLIAINGSISLQVPVLSQSLESRKCTTKAHLAWVHTTSEGKMIKEVHVFHFRDVGKLVTDSDVPHLVSLRQVEKTQLNYEYSLYCIYSCYLVFLKLRFYLIYHKIHRNSNLFPLLLHCIHSFLFEL